MDKEICEQCKKKADDRGLFTYAFISEDLIKPIETKEVCFDCRKNLTEFDEMKKQYQNN